MSDIYLHIHKITVSKKAQYVICVDTFPVFVSVERVKHTRTISIRNPIVSVENVLTRQRLIRIGAINREVIYNGCCIGITKV